MNDLDVEGYNRATEGDSKNSEETSFDNVKVGAEGDLEDPLDAFMRTLNTSERPIQPRGEILDFDQVEPASPERSLNSSDDEIGVNAAALKNMQQQKRRRTNEPSELKETEVVNKISIQPPPVFVSNKREGERQASSAEEEDEEEDLADEELNAQRITIPPNFDWNAMLTGQTRPPPMPSSAEAKSATLYRAVEPARIVNPSLTRKRFRVHVQGFNVPPCILLYEDLLPSIEPWPGSQTFIDSCITELVTPAGLEAQLIPCLLSHRSCVLSYERGIHRESLIHETPEKYRALDETSISRMALSFYLKELFEQVRNGQTDRPSQIILCPNDDIALNLGRHIRFWNDKAEKVIKTSMITDAAEKSIAEYTAGSSSLIIITQRQLLRWLAEATEDLSTVKTFVVLCFRGSEDDRLADSVIDSSITRCCQLQLARNPTMVFVTDGSAADIEDFAKRFIPRTVRISCDTEDNKYLTELKHRFMRFGSEAARVKWLEGALPVFLKNEGAILIFCNSEIRAVDVACLLKHSHSKSRIDVLRWQDLVKNGTLSVRAKVSSCLITTTPVAMKGLRNLSDVQFRTVINYDMPRSSFEYHERASFLEPDSKGNPEIFSTVVIDHHGSCEPLLPSESGGVMASRPYKKLYDVAAELALEFHKADPRAIPQILQELALKNGSFAKNVLNANKEAIAPLPSLFQASHGLEPKIIPSLNTCASKCVPPTPPVVGDKDTTPASINNIPPLPNPAKRQELDEEEDYECDDSPHITVTFKHPESKLLLPKAELAARRRANLDSYLALCAEKLSCEILPTSTGEAFSQAVVFPQFLETISAPSESAARGGGVGFSSVPLNYGNQAAAPSSEISQMFGNMSTTCTTPFEFPLTTSGPSALNAAAAAILAKVNARHKDLKMV